MSLFFYENEYLKLKVTEENFCVCKIEFVDEIGEYIETNLSRQFQSQMNKYFAGKTDEIDVPFSLRVSEYTFYVLREVDEILYGETVTYKQLAEMVGNAKAVRSVANALAKNPLPLLIPCHRVIRSTGETGGYQGGVELKKTLLNLERNFFQKI